MELCKPRKRRFKLGFGGEFLIETRLGVPTMSFAPSVASIYGARLKVAGALFVAISQSGRSPDLIASAQAARDAGALVVTIVNADESPLARVGQICLPLHAGRERSVAAVLRRLPAKERREYPGGDYSFLAGYGGP